MKEFTFEKTITKQEIDDIMSSALQGITYWCDEIKAIGDDEKYASEILTIGGRIRIHDTEEDKWHTLTLSKLLKALSITKKHNYDDYDMYDADILVQLALFGKVVYA